MGKKKNEKQRKRVSAVGVFNGFYRWNHRRNVSVGDSISDSAMSLYDYLSLNPSVIPSVKSSEKIVRQRYGQYIPTKYFPSVYTDRISDGCIP